MLTSKIISAALIGLDCSKVEIESDCGAGAVAFHMVGLADKSVEESRERVRSAIRNSGLLFPRSRVTVNLAPADLKKKGSLYDFPIAMSILKSSNQLKDSDIFKQSVFLGELSLDGSLRGVFGVLPIIIGMKELGFKKFFIPFENSEEASLVGGIEIYPIKEIKDVFLFFKKKIDIDPIRKTKFLFDKKPKCIVSLDSIKGQIQAKRALMIAASGGHNILLNGPPGSGKSMLGKSLISILPELTLKESLEVTKIYSIAGMLSKENGLINIRPYRSPHHSSSAASIVGGGTIPNPGEISLAHRGVLFLDEFAEFPRCVLEHLRQPLEDGVVHISRVSRTIRYPCKFILVAAMNPCPCGYSTDDGYDCTCNHSQILRYVKKISGPILDRIDLHVEVPRLSFEELYEDKMENDFSQEMIKKKINQARKIQDNRFFKFNIYTNSEMKEDLIKKYCYLDSETRKLLKKASLGYRLSARSCQRLIKVSRTIADLDGKEKIEVSHLAEAFQYRPINYFGEK